MSILVNWSLCITGNFISKVLSPRALTELCKIRLFWVKKLESIISKMVSSVCKQSAEGKREFFTKGKQICFLVDHGSREQKWSGAKMQWPGRKKVRKWLKQTFSDGRRLRMAHADVLWRWETAQKDLRRFLSETTEKWSLLDLILILSLNIFKGIPFWTRKA